jgi:short-subunit dehydrogenase
MLERGRGHVVLVSSLSGKVASPRSGLYSATKFGLRGFAAGLRAGTWISQLVPVTAARVQRKLGSERIADALSEAQRDQR